MFPVERSTWEFTTVAIDELAVATALTVFAFTTAASDVDAVVTSDCVASEPEESPAPVRVRVAELHTSTASVPNVVSERDEYAQTFAGIERMELAIEAIEAPRELEAAVTIALVFAFTTDASEEDAPSTAALVFAFTRLATDVEETIFDVTWNVRSSFTKSPPPSVPQEI
jgi:hypothetical protein